MPAVPRWLKISLLSLLGFVIAGWLVWFFFSSQITSFFKSRFVSLPKIELAEEGFPVRVYSSLIEVVSDIPGLKVEKVDMTKFNELLKEWDVFGQNKMFLYVLQEINPNDISKTFITPKKIILHLTDKEQRYNKTQIKGSEGKSVLISSVGEVWDADLKVLELYFHTTIPETRISEILPEAQATIAAAQAKLITDEEILNLQNKYFNQLALMALYDRTHIKEKDHPAKLIEVDILAGKLFTEGKLSFRVIK